QLGHNFRGSSPAYMLPPDANRGHGHPRKRSQFTKAQSSVEWDASRGARCHDLDSPDGMKIRPVGKSLDKRSSQSAISIALRYINMKMCRVVLANILNVPKIRNIIEMGKFCRIFEAACEISDAPAVIKSNKEAVSMCCNISSERHFTKRLLFFLAAKITSSAGFKKMSSISPRWLVKSAISSALRISITLPTLRHRRGEKRLGKFERDLTMLKRMLGFQTGIDGRGRGRVAHRCWNCCILFMAGIVV